MSDAVTSPWWAQASGQGHDWIAARVPHQGSMCLLGRVLDASPEGILCAADSHHTPDHPMRQHGRLGAACGVEYAAQAMACAAPCWPSSAACHARAAACW